jgi:hypothetical protein
MGARGMRECVGVQTAFSRLLAVPSRLCRHGKLLGKHAQPIQKPTLDGPLVLLTPELPRSTSKTI